MLPKLFVQVVVFATSLLLITPESHASLAKPGCQEVCGNVTIPYPFGIGKGCYLHESFEVSCRRSSQDHVPQLWFASKHKFRILEFSKDLVRVMYKPIMVCVYINASAGPSLILDQYFSFSQDHNLYVAVGCNIQAFFMLDRFNVDGCQSLCNGRRTGSAMGCTGSNGCCQLSIRERITSYTFSIEYNTTNGSLCAHAFISEKSASISSHKPYFHVPVSLYWVVGDTTCHKASKTGYKLCGSNTYCVDSTNSLGYNCHCRKGYKGNPYLSNGCQVTIECPKQSNHYCEARETCVRTNGSYKCISTHHNNLNVLVITLATVTGLSAFGIIGYWTYIKLDRRKKTRIKKKFFEKNGGHLLRQLQSSSTEPRVMIIKVYTAEEMEKATGNFSRSRVLGKGGQGTVYKGLLSDGTVVAIKKSNVVDTDQVVRFVNEVFTLAQINHRNIVKLLGCCLDYEVPLLVYEYLANNTLAQYLHDGTEDSEFSWIDRIRIAREVAGALSYLHTYAAPTIIHRDIKPDNILLDQNYKAVVSDFGLSRSVPLCRSYITTQVKGTFGYLDPGYFHSGQLTTKSDVYSFGVVLTELLTRKKAIFVSESGEGLVPKFKNLVKRNQFVEILDKQVVQEAMMDDLVLVAKLAKRCMKMKSNKRPSMEEVVADLDKLKVVQLISSL